MSEATHTHVFGHTVLFKLPEHLSPNSVVLETTTVQYCIHTKEGYQIKILYGLCLCQ